MVGCVPVVEGLLGPSADLVAQVDDRVALECGHDPDGGVDVAGEQRCGVSASDVGQLEIELLTRTLLVGPVRARSPVLAVLECPPGEALANVVRLAGLGGLVDPVLPHGLEHPVAGAVCSQVGCHHRLVDELGDDVDHVPLVDADASADGARRVEGEPVLEERQTG